MADGTVGVGVIGRGFGQTVVAPVFAETDGCALVDVISPRDADAVRALCEHPDVDLVAVHAPPFLHARCVTAALDAGKAVLCDKPFGTSTADAEAMEAAARDADAVALLNFEFRHHPGRIALRALLQDGAVGTVEHIQWTVFGAGFRVPMRPYGWLFDRERGGGWIGAWGSHVIDFLPLDLRRSRRRERATAHRHHRAPRRRRHDAHLHRRGRVHRAPLDRHGVSVTIDTSFVAVKNAPPRVVVLGSEGTLESIADGKITLRTAEGTQEVFSFDPPREDPHLVPMRAWAAVVRDAVREGTVPDGVPTFADGVACRR